jgi:hypothetical protein
MECEDMAEQKVEWHLKKEVSYGHILSTLILAGMLVASWMDVQRRMVVLEQHPSLGSHVNSERRLDVLESSMARTVAIDTAMQLRIEDLQVQIMRSLDRQDVKLDRIEDRLNQHDADKE